MYREKLADILERYIERFDEMNETGKNKPDAAYKWRVMEAASKLNLDADDLSLEFENLAMDTEKLMESSRVQPTGGITILLQHDEEKEFVREEFKRLLADVSDPEEKQDRINDFIDDINRHLSIYLDKIDIYKQTLTSAIGYLSILKPKDNYFYRPATAESWAMSIEFSDDFGHARTFSLRKYYKMCDELQKAVQEYTEVIDLNQKRLEKENITVDDDLHMLVYDIMYCTDTYHLDENKRKMTVKERLSRAVIREERDNIMDQLIDIDKRLKVIGDDFDIPDPVGDTVTHKTFGKGVIKSCADGKVEIEFAVGMKKFQYPDAFSKGFLVADSEETMKALQSDADSMTERRNLEIEKLRLEDSLRYIG